MKKQRKERPILMSTDLVRKTLADQKTQTRRLKGLWKINQHPDAWRFDGFNKEGRACFADARTRPGGPDTCFFSLSNPYGQPGDLLYVREAWCIGPDGLIFRADYGPEPTDYTWKPSIHMKKVHARLWLEITDIRIERLQDISESDALDEGLPLDIAFPIVAFRVLWDSINAKRMPWKANPWVWVVEYKRVER